MTVLHKRRKDHRGCGRYRREGRRVGSGCSRLTQLLLLLSRLRGTISLLQQSHRRFGAGKEEWRMPLKGQDRQYHLDCLRVLATFAVMILHIAAQNWYGADVMSFEWNVFNFYDSMVRWAVPVGGRDWWLSGGRKCSASVMKSAK